MAFSISIAEEMRKKYRRNTEEISKLNINGDTNILME